MIAIKGRHFEIVRILIENKVDLNLTDEHGNTSLMLACYELDVLPSVQLMFEQNILIDLQNKEGKTALMIALHKRHLDMVRVLIEHGSNLDLIDSNHNSALMFAVRHNESVCYQIVETKKNVKINLLNCQSETALMIVLKTGNFKIVQLLIANKAHVNSSDPEGRTLFTQTYLYCKAKPQIMALYTINILIFYCKSSIPL